MKNPSTILDLTSKWLVERSSNGMTLGL